MDEQVLTFDWETVVRPPFGVWHPVGDLLEVRVLATDEWGTLRVRFVGTHKLCALPCTCECHKGSVDA